MSAHLSSRDEAGKLDRATRILLLIAAAWAAGLVLAGGLVPVYGSSAAASTTAGKTVWTSTTGTLVEVNGPRVLALLALPFLAVGLVGVALRHRRTHQRCGAGGPAWLVTGLLGAVSVLGVLTIGPFLAPVAVLLAVVCARAPRGQQPADRASAPHSA
jgi:hypothetical protein